MAACMTSLALMYTHHSMPGLLLSPAIEGSFMEAQGTGYSSGRRTLRSLGLPDGTRVVMNRGTRIAVLYAEGTRSVMLVRGEATFTVPPQAHKVFHFWVGNQHFSTMASAFNVRLTGDSIQLTVLDGTVEIPPMSHTRAGGNSAVPRDGAERPPAPRLLKALQLLDEGPGMQAARTLTQSEAQARIAWQRG
jgi:transmembrane sensor